jgi:hypothetical protein
MIGFGSPEFGAAESVRTVRYRYEAGAAGSTLAQSLSAGTSAATALQLQVPHVWQLRRPVELG